MFRCLSVWVETSPVLSISDGAFAGCRLKEKETMIEAAVEKSRELFESGFYCAESVLMVVAEAKGCRSELIPKIATGFCSGQARTSGQCGALTGAILSINLFFGRSHPEESVEENYDRVRRLIENFTKKFGSANCSDLVECHLGTPEGQAFFNQNHKIKACFDYTQEATRIALQVLEDVAGA